MDLAPEYALRRGWRANPRPRVVVAQAAVQAVSSRVRELGEKNERASVHERKRVENPKGCRDGAGTASATLGSEA